MNLPNALTVVRLFMVPVFVLVLANDNESWAGRALAAAIFLIASFTDLVDGRVARQRGQITNFGIIADPIADKALTGAALISLSVMNELNWWVTVVILVREVGITLMRFAIIKQQVLPASRAGKTKTAFQMVAITLYLLQLPTPLSLLAPIAMAGAVILTVITGIDYIVQTKRLNKVVPA